MIHPYCPCDHSDSSLDNTDMENGDMYNTAMNNGNNDNGCVDRYINKCMNNGSISLSIEVLKKTLLCFSYCWPYDAFSKKNPRYMCCNIIF